MRNIGHKSYMEKEVTRMEGCVNGWRYTNGGILLLPIKVHSNKSVVRYLLTDRAVSRYTKEYGLNEAKESFNRECLDLIVEDLKTAMRNENGEGSDVKKQNKRGKWVRGKSLSFYVHGSCVENLKIIQENTLRRDGNLRMRSGCVLKKGRKKKIPMVGAVCERAVLHFNLRRES